MNRTTAVGIAAASAAAAKNHYERTGNAAQAAGVGTEAAGRWYVWGGACLMNLVAMGWGLLGNLFMVMFCSLSTLGIGVMFCRNVDFCLFRRGWLYRLFQDFAKPTESWSWWVLYLPTALNLAWVFQSISSWGT